MNSEEFTSDEKRILSGLYQQYEDSEIELMPHFDTVLERANKQKVEQRRVRYLSIAAAIALLLSAFIWRYWTIDKAVPSSNNLNYEFYTTWEMPSDELLSINVYEISFEFDETPTNVLLNQNDEVNYENQNQ